MIYRFGGIALLLFLGAFYFFADPVSGKLMPKCVFHVITGLDCPGCGSQRMVHSLLHGDFQAAWGYNPFLLCILPLIPLYFILDFYPGRFRRLSRILHSPIFLGLLMVAVIIWTILRNIH